MWFVKRWLDFYHTEIIVYNLMIIRINNNEQVTPLPTISIFPKLHNVIVFCTTNCTCTLSIYDHKTFCIHTLFVNGILLNFEHNDPWYFIKVEILGILTPSVFKQEAQRYKHGCFCYL